MNLKLFGRVIFLSKPLILIIVVLVSIPVVWGGYHLISEKDKVVVGSQTTLSKTPETLGTSIFQTSEPEKLISVYIVGAVANPGMYKFSEKPLVYDVILKAGGVCESADVGYINMAQEIGANLMIRILTEQERAAEGRESALVIVGNEQEGVPSQPQSSEEKGSKVNINTAGISGLTTLPGIGEKRAQDIIAYRESNGKFGKIEDIMLVAGIKEAAFSKIKDLITV